MALGNRYQDQGFTNIPNNHSGAVSPPVEKLLESK